MHTASIVGTGLLESLLEQLDDLVVLELLRNLQRRPVRFLFHSWIGTQCKQRLHVMHVPAEGGPVERGGATLQQ